MNFKTLSILFFLSLMTSSLIAQETVFGKWKTIDDETNEAKSIVEIYQRNGKVYGKIVKLFRNANEDPDPVCDKCPNDDPRKGKKIIGMEIMKDMKKDGSSYSGGKILKPDEGDIYKCKIWLEDGKLYVRGYWGFFYRTQVWERAR
ncbi:MAG: DUF2147 domain-containing protein [Bacteroidota bacterium]